MPAVAVRSRPNGWPMATTSSPTRTASESANVSGRSVPTRDGSTRRTARSVEGSEPSTSASTVAPESPKRTLAWLDSPTTCAFVTIVPRLSITKPVPEPPLTWTATTPSATAA